MAQPIGRVGVCVLLAIMRSGGTTEARPWTDCEITKQLSPMGAQGQGFGSAAAATTAWVVVGEPAFPGGGAVYAYREPASEPEQILASDREVGDALGSSLSLNGETLLAGAPFHDSPEAYSGVVYVFTFDGAAWIESATFRPAVLENGARFGWSVALDGDTAVVGAPYEPAAWVFRFDGVQWVEEVRLYGSDTLGAFEFGRSVAVEGDVAVVGAPSDDEDGMYAGAAYVFERLLPGAWVETAKLLPTQGYPFRNFGESVAIDGGTVVVGAPGDGQGAGLPGSAYVFEKNKTGAWQQRAELTDPNEPAPVLLGISVAIDGGTIVAGARHFYEPNGPVTGAAYVFTRDPARNWSMTARLLADDGTAWDWFGNAVAISSKLAVIGAPRDEPFGPWSGSAYVFAVGPDNDGDGLMDACGCTGDINDDWSVDQADLGALLNDYGGVPNDPAADLNGDGVIGQEDLGILLANYGAVCP